MRLKSKKTVLSVNLKFSELSQETQEFLIKAAMDSPPACTWTTDHPSYLEGKQAAMNWVREVSLLDIRDLVDSSSHPTHTAVTGGVFKIDKHDELCWSEVAYEISKFLGSNVCPAPATEENLQFETGFHLGVVSVDILLETYFDLR